MERRLASSCTNGGPSTPAGDAATRMGDPMELDEKPRLRGRRSRLGAADGDEEEEDQLNEEFGMPHFSALEKDHAIGIDIGVGPAPSDGLQGL